MVGRTLDESEGIAVRLSAHPYYGSQFGNSLVSVLIQPSGVSHFTKGHMTQPPPFYWQLTLPFQSMFVLSQPQLDGP